MKETAKKALIKDIVIYAVSLYGVGLKAMISLFLGWIAAPVTIIADIVKFVKADDSVVYAEEIE